VRQRHKHVNENVFNFNNFTTTHRHRMYDTNVCHVPSVCVPTHSLISGAPKSCVYNNTCTRASKYSNRNATGYKYKILINNPPELHDYNSSLCIRKATYYSLTPLCIQLYIHVRALRWPVLTL